MTTHPFTTNYLHEEKVMKLWLLTRTDQDDPSYGYWDTYDSAVVAADTECEARTIHPRERVHVTDDGTWLRHHEDGGFGVTLAVDNTWAKPEDIIVKYLGEAKPDTKSGVICASFNAG